MESEIRTILQRVERAGLQSYLAEKWAVDAVRKPLPEPVRRRVAVKILKPGMDTRQVIARFEAERQALAMMDHPNIAKVLEAGVVTGGSPVDFTARLTTGGPPVATYRIASETCATNLNADPTGFGTQNRISAEKDCAATSESVHCVFSRWAITLIASPSTCLLICGSELGGSAGFILLC